MDFIDELRALASRIPKQLEHLQTEEGAKHALVMPFINALGYNVFDPTEVTPEFVADVGIKKGEKVDYVVLQDGKPIMLFECKGFRSDLDKQHPTQLYRYFSVTETRFAVLTNGILYRFFTDLEASNKMDSKHFFEFNMLDITDASVDELKRFTKTGFDLDQNINAATELKYTKEIKRVLSEQMADPSDELVRFFAGRIYTGKLTAAVRQQFADITKRALNQFVSDRVSDRLKSALADESASSKDSKAGVPETSVVESPPAQNQEKQAITTELEMESFYIVKSILRETTDSSRIVHRDQLSYFGILLDNNNRKPIRRLHFGTSRKLLGLFDKDRQEERVPLETLDDIYTYGDRLKATVGLYDSSKQT